MRLFALSIVTAFLITACSSDPAPAPEDGAAATRSSGDATQDPAGDSAALPALNPGGVGSGQLTIDDTTVDYLTVVPAGFEVGDTAPVLLAFPPGDQSIGVTQSLVENTYMAEALSRGWVVVSPAAPGGRKFFEGSEALVPGLVDWIESWVIPEGGKPHIAGVSNGGISSFRVAGENPERFQSVLVFPGFPRDDSDRDALAGLASLPIRMFAGEDDAGWVSAMDEAFELLRDLGADVVFEVFPGEGHIVRALSDGQRIFDELDALR